MNQLDADLRPLVAATAPVLMAVDGVGTEVAAQLLVTAGYNAGRLRSEAAFAQLCGTAPLLASAAAPPDTGSTEAATGTPTTYCTSSP